MYQTSLPAPIPLAKSEQNAKALGFAWVKASPELVVGDVGEFARKNGVQAERTAGFWYGPTGPDGDVDRRASPDEWVIYHLHGEFPVVSISG